MQAASNRIRGQRITSRGTKMEDFGHSICAWNSRWGDCGTTMTLRTNMEVKYEQIGFGRNDRK